MSKRIVHRPAPPVFDWWKWCEQERLDRAWIQLQDATILAASGPLYAGLRIRNGDAFYSATLHLFIGDRAGWWWRLWTRGLLTDVSTGDVLEIQDHEETEGVRDRAAGQLARALLQALRGEDHGHS